MKPCSNPLCTNQIGDDDRFCGMCGTYVGPDITQVGKQCVNCGRTLQPGHLICSNCGSFTTFVKPQPAVYMDTQANIPTFPSTPILPPLKVATITREEVEVVRLTTKNVYTPHMRHLIDFHIQNFSVDFTGESIYGSLSNIGVLIRDLEVTDFTFQLNFSNAFGFFNTPLRGAGFVFRFNTQTGEGYRFFLDSATLLVQLFHTRSKITGEPLRELNVSETLIAQTYPFVGLEHLIALVAQKGTLDLYVDLVHLKRVENATLLQGKVGFNLLFEKIIKFTETDEQWHSQREEKLQNLFDQIKVWTP